VPDGEDDRVASLEEAIGKGVGATQLALRALEALFDLGQDDLVERVKRETIAGLGDSFDDPPGYDGEAIEAAAREQILILVAAVLATRRKTPSRGN
jgi:hypothetical protein